MQTSSIQLSDVIYNAANQTFEALVSIHNEGRMRKFACAIKAPISMSFEQAAEGLTKQAIRRDTQRSGMYSELMMRTAKLRAGRPRFDPRRWLESIVALPGNRTA